MSPRGEGPFRAASLACLLAVVLPSGLFAGGAPAEPGPGEQVRADAHGDPLPPGALLRLGTVRWRACARYLAFTPDGKTLLTGEGNGDQPIRFLDAATGKETGTYRPASYVLALALSPDGKTLALDASRWSKVGVVLFLSVPQSKEIRRIEATTALPGGILYYNRLEFSRDGKNLAAVGSDGVVRVWDAATGKEILREQEQGDGRRALLAFSPDGKRLAVAGQPSTLRLLEVATGKELFKLELDQKEVRWVTMAGFSPDGKKLLWMGEDSRSFALRDATTGEPVLSFRVSKGTVRPVAFSPDGKLIASVDSSGDDPPSHRLWDAATGKELRKLPPPAGDWIGEFVFSPDGKRLAASTGYDGLLHVWDVETGKDLAQTGEHRAGVCSVGFSPDGRTAFTGCADGIVRVWDADKGAVLRRIEVGGNGDDPRDYHIVFSRDRRAGVVTNHSRNASIWDLDLGKLRAPLDWGEDKAWEAVFTPDGKTLATISRTEGVPLWDAATGKKGSRIEIDKIGLGDFAFFPDGKTLVAQLDPDRRGDDKAVVMSLWDVALGKELRKWSLPPEWAGYMLQVSPDGRKIAMANAQGVGLWDAASGKKLPPLLVPNYWPAVGWMDCFAFSSDGKTLAAGGGAGVIYLWEVNTAQPRALFLGHRGRVRSLDFSPDGARLISGSEDTTALIWDLTGLAVEGKAAKALTPEDLTALWEALADPDGGTAYRAGWRLAAEPEASVPFLRKHVRPAEIDTSQIPKWLAALGGDDFEEREEATRRLAKLGDAAGPAVRQALEGKPSPEARRRLEELARGLDKPVEAPEEARALRCVEVLEHIGSAEARRLLDELGRGTPGVRVTREAKAALDRLAKRPSGRSDP